jgi:hypothetical protein
MKKLRNFFMLLAVLAGFTGAFAFRTAHSPEKRATGTQWFTLITGDNPSQTASYVAVGTDDPGCPTSPNTVCAIFTHTGTDGNPLASDLAAIKTASDNFTKAANNLEYQPVTR